MNARPMNAGRVNARREHADQSDGRRVPPAGPGSEGPLDEAPRLRGGVRVIPREPAAADPRRPVRVARFVSAALVVLCLAGAVQVMMLLGVEAERLWRTEAEVARLEGDLVGIERESLDLLEIARRGEDLRYREHLARRQGYVFPDETRFVGPRTPP